MKLEDKVVNMNNCFVLLCALSVGAAIVIARPDGVADSTGEPRLNIDGTSLKDNKNSDSFWERAKDKTKTVALTTIEVSKDLAHRTAETSVYLADRIGSTLAHIIE